MADNALHIRQGMDVYGPYQNEYIGTVVAVVRSGERQEAGAGPVETGSSREAVQGNPELVHEEGATVSPTPIIERPRLGEEIGPVPTIALGNTGPIEQSASHHYGTEPVHGGGEVTHFAVRPGRINLGVLTPPFWVSVEDVRSISMERIVLWANKDQISRFRR